MAASRESATRRRLGLRGMVAVASVSAMAIALLVGFWGTAASSAKSSAKKSPLIIVDEAPINSIFGNDPQDFAGAQAAALEINRAGGVNGHPIKIVTCNNSATAAGDTACSRTAVSDHAIAEIGEAPYDTIDDSVLGPAKIASTFAGPAGTQYQQPTEYPLNGTSFLESVEQPLAAKAAGATKVGIIYTQFPGESVVAYDIAKVAREIGLKVVLTTSVTTTQTTFSAQVAQLQAAGANAVIPSVLPASYSALLAAAQAVSYSPVWVDTAGAFASTAELKTTLELAHNAWIVADLPPADAASHYAGLKVYQTEMKAAEKAGIANTSVANQNEQSISAWATVHGYAQVAATIKGRITGATVLAAVGKAKNISIDSLVTWSPGAPSVEKAYPHLTKDDALVYYGPEHNGVWTPKPLAGKGGLNTVVLK